MMKLNSDAQKVLAFLVEQYSYEGFGYCPFGTISANTQLERKVVRRACRLLARKGLAEYGKGLWTEDGEPAGSGYSATRAGKEHIDEESNRRKDRVTQDHKAAEGLVGQDQGEQSQAEPTAR